MEDPWSFLPLSFQPWLAVLVFFVLILLSGVFSLFDYALNACRKPRLQKESLGNCGRFYERVLKTLENPHFVLYSCRFWVNMLRVLGAFWAGISLIRFLEILHVNVPVKDGAVILIAVVTVFVLGSAAFLLGDLIPKFCARIAPEKIAGTLLLPVTFFSLPFKPVNFIFQRLGLYLRQILKLEEDTGSMTEDELRLALDEGEKSGIVESNQRTMLEGVFYLGDRPIGAFMTHRSEVHWLDVNAGAEEIRAKALEHRSQRCFPVTDGSQDEIVGAVYLEDIILDQAEPNPRGLRAIMNKPHFVPETMSAIKAFESFKQCKANFLFVMDEYGGLSGIISAKALLEEIVGDLSASQHEEKHLIQQEDGTWLADGLLNIDDAARALSLFIDQDERSNYHTLAGFVLSIAGELPCAGDSFERQGYRFLVKNMDGNRIDKLIIEPLKK